MTHSITLANPATINSHHEPFCDKEFKCLRVTGDLLFSLIASLFYKIISLGCWILCCKTTEREYGALAHYHFRFGFGKLFAYASFGDQVIDFSFNGPNGIRPLSQNEKRQFEQWCQDGSTDEIPVEVEIAENLPYKTGCCLGMSLDFIYHYLNSSQSEPLDKIKECASMHVEGASKDAQMLQMIVSGQKKTKLLKKRSKEIKQIQNEVHLQAIELKKTLDQEQERISKIRDIKQTSKELNDIIKTSHAKLDDFEKQSKAKIQQSRSNYSREIIKPIAALRGIQLKEALIYAEESFETTEDSSEFRDSFMQLNIGAYLLLIRRHDDKEKDISGCAHAEALIIEEECSYLFDPNYATVGARKEEIFHKIWEFAKDFYLKEGDCTISLHRASISS